MPIQDLRICYHGTTHANAASILETGFRPGTYFAYHLEDAIGFGNGKAGYVFEVVFPDEQLAGAAPQRVATAWQFTNMEVVPADRVVAHYRLAKTQISDNPELRKSVFHAAKARRLGGDPNA